MSESQPYEGVNQSWTWFHIPCSSGLEVWAPGERAKLFTIRARSGIVANRRDAFFGDAWINLRRVAGEGTRRTGFAGSQGGFPRGVANRESVRVTGGGRPVPGMENHSRGEDLSQPRDPSRPQARPVRWTTDRSDGVLPETKCAECGVVAGESTEGWTHCEDCGTHYCPNCSGTFRQEKQDIDTLRKGSASERLRVLCPSCGLELV